MALAEPEADITVVAPAPHPSRAVLTSLTAIVDAVALTGGIAAARLPLGIALVFGVTAFIALAASGTQGNRIHPRLADDMPRLIGSLGGAALIVGPIADAVGAGTAYLTGVPIVVGMVLLGRGLEHHLVRKARARRDIVEPIVVVGAGSLGRRVIQTLVEHPEFGLFPVGVVDDAARADLPVPLLGPPSELTAIVHEYSIRRIITAFGSTSESDMVRVLRACDRLPVEVHVLPRFFELGVAPQEPTIDDLWGLPLMRLRRSALRTWAWRVKRAVDLVLAGAALIVASPIFGAAALGVRLSSPGPIFFRQIRVGQRGKEFELLKFRTMPENSDSDSTWNVAGDPRRTTVGKFLRKTGLDELPQLLNVVAGDMSLVGPRPERPLFVDQFRVTVQSYDERHRVPTGITGWAQVHGLRGDTSIAERAVFDNHYIEHWSLWRDVVILCRTVATILRGEGG